MKEENFNGKELALKSINHYFQFGESQIVKSKEYCSLSVKKGNKLALSFQTLMGWEEKADQKRALMILEEYIKECQDQDQLSYCYFLLTILFQDKEGQIPLDPKKYLHYLDKAVELNNMIALHTYANIYEYGDPQLGKKKY